VTILTLPPMMAAPPRVHSRLPGLVLPLAFPARPSVETACSWGPSPVMTAIRTTTLAVWLTVQAPSLAGPVLEAVLLLPLSANSVPTARRRAPRLVTTGQMTGKDAQ